MKIASAELLLVIVLVVSSSSDGTASEFGPNYFPDTCAATISTGSGCNAGNCATVCASRFIGGVGSCEQAGCRCIYACPSSPPVRGGEK